MSHSISYTVKSMLLIIMVKLLQYSLPDEGNSAGCTVMGDTEGSFVASDEGSWLGTADGKWFAGYVVGLFVGVLQRGYQYSSVP